MTIFRRLVKRIMLVWIAGSMLACVNARWRHAEEAPSPELKITSYTKALGDLGLMTEIYATPRLRIQCAPVGDNTGTAAPSGGEIPRDITEILKTVLNTIGGRVVFIPFDPYFIQNEVLTGYSKFEQKVIPDVVLSGGITEFDRGLETLSENVDASVGVEAVGLPDSLPSKDVEVRYAGARKSALSSITLDFNLLDFKTLTGIPRMNAVNTMKLYKSLNDQEIGISIFGQAFGLKGSVKRVHGRHAAVRVLVEISMIQVIGKHLRLPYWRLLGNNIPPDPLVMEALRNYYRYLTDDQTVANIQEWLNLYGYALPITGQFTSETRMALLQIYPKWDNENEKIDWPTFAHIYINIPLTPEAQAKRVELFHTHQDKAP